VCDKGRQREERLRVRKDVGITKTAGKRGAAEVKGGGGKQSPLEKGLGLSTLDNHPKGVKVQGLGGGANRPFGPRTKKKSGVQDTPQGETQVPERDGPPERWGSRKRPRRIRPAAIEVTSEK